MKYLIAAFLFAFSFTTIDAQLLSYSNGSVEYEDQMVKTISVKLNPKPEAVRESFENWMDDKYDVNLHGKKLLFFNKDIMSAKGVVIPEISKNKIDLLVKVDETESNATTLNVFASFGYNNWITSDEYPFEYNALEEIVQNYIYEYLPKYYLGKVEDSRDELADLKEDKKDLNEEMKENEEKIANLTKENEELMMKWKENQQKIKNTNAKISKRNEELNTINKRVKSNK